MNTSIKNDIKRSFKIIKGSVLEQEVDAIVNAANGYMLHGGGIASAILRAAGPELNNACRSFDLPIRVGNAITTPAFNIKNAKIIIHAVAPDFGKYPDAYNELYNAYYNSLVELKNNGYHSIAFPLISSGIFGGSQENPVATSTKYCIEAYNNFINNNLDYEIDVTLCAFTNDEYEKAMKQYEEMNR